MTPWLRRRSRRAGAVMIVAVILGWLGASDDARLRPASAQLAAQPDARPDTQPPAKPDAGKGTLEGSLYPPRGVPSGEARQHDAHTVRITFQTNPPERAEVRWGRRRLGFIEGPRQPFVIDRPRDSGPLDVVIRAEGYLPVNTRAYTFSDSKITVKLTRLEDKPTLFGYRAEIPDAGAPD